MFPFYVIVIHDFGFTQNMSTKNEKKNLRTLLCIINTLMLLIPYLMSQASWAVNEQLLSLHFPLDAMPMSIFQSSDTEKNICSFVLLRQNVFEKGCSDPFQNSKVFPWTVWTFGYLSNCVGAKHPPAATLILTTKTPFNGRAKPILAAVISSNAHLRLPPSAL